LQNSTDAKVIEQLEQDLTKQKDLLNQTIELLGKTDIKTLSDLENLLQGKTLKELINQKEKTIIGLNKSYEKLTQKKQEQAHQLEQQLEQTRERLAFYQNNLKTKETIIEDYKKDLAQANQSRERRKERIDLAQAKINELETQLFNLAKQKLANKKEAQALVSQLEQQWQEKQKE
jgi:chromosome segregation ATPase